MQDGGALEASNKLDEHLIELETRLLDPVVRARVDDLASLLADDFLEFGYSGRIHTKSDVLGALPLQDSDGEIVARDFRVAHLSPTVALVTYRSERRVNGASTRHALRASIWTRAAGAWRMRFHQGTPTKAD